jgi:hypothetical protein
MVNRYLKVMTVIVALVSAFDAHAQEATEMYIPIGQSPGVSGKSSLIGTLESVDAAKRTVTVAGPSGARTVGLTDRTSIWLDRSLQKQPNRSGTMTDLQQGRRVEVKLRKDEPNPFAEWIKIQVAGVRQ